MTEEQIAGVADGLLLVGPIGLDRDDLLARVLDERRRLLEALRAVRSFTMSPLAHEQADEAIAFAEEPAP